MPQTGPLHVGDRCTVVTTFKNEAGVLTSPVTVTGEYRAPSATTPTPLAATESSTGVWRMLLPTFTEGGIWAWHIAGTSGLIAADQGTIRVDSKVTAPL